jgi:hypothetical protein
MHVSGNVKAFAGLVASDAPIVRIAMRLRFIFSFHQRWKYWKRKSLFCFELDHKPRRPACSS